MDITSIQVTDYDPVNHVYRVGDRVVPSVSQIIYQSGVFPFQSKKVQEAAERGSLVHLSLETLDSGGDLVGSCPTEIQEYWISIRDRFGTLVAVEPPLHHAQWWYAGTPDRIYERDGLPVVVDIKTGSTIRPEYALQTIGYAAMLTQLGFRLRDIRRFLVLLDLRKVIECISPVEDWAAFMAAWQLYQWRQVCPRLRESEHP